MDYPSLNSRMLKKIENAIRLYENRIYSPVKVIDEAASFETTEHFRTPPLVEYNPLKSGDRWGKEFGSMWIKSSFKVNEDLDGKTLYLCENTGAREILCFINGKPKGMFSTATSDFFKHNALILAQNARSGETINIDLECYAWHYEPGVSAYENLGKDVASPSEFTKTFNNISVCLCNDSLKEMVIAAKIALDIANNSKNDVLKAKTTAILQKAFGDIILFPDLYTAAEIEESAAKAVEILKPLFDGNYGKTNGFVGILGHSHMDTAWLWPMKETVRKCARTYSNALSLMEIYPEYKFIQSSVLHTYWMEKYYPDIFCGIKKMVAEGRYEPNGGAWVECDCNLTGGEYLIRQFLKGQRYLKKNFDYRADCFWLPDTFGYSAAIPQIMLGCGVKYFYTTKLDWNEHTKFPYESFRWKGIDGSEVISHLNTQGCSPMPSNIENNIRNLQNKTADCTRLCAFGYGDGGGGPADTMVRVAQLVKNIDGMPQMEYTTAGEFARNLDKKRDDLPLYNGELYLELHRGTLTQMHDIKRNNRKAEIALHNMELINVISGAEYDAADYDKKVKTLLENQFHDILPGTSLKCVHDKSIEATSTLIKEANDETERLMGNLLENSDSITLFNPVSFNRNDPIHIKSKRGIKNVKNQKVQDIFGRELMAVSGVALRGFEAKSYNTVDVCEGLSPFKYDGRKLETPYAILKFNENGYISSFIDKASGRQLCKEGSQPLGTFYMGENIAVFWDNWDIEYDQKFKMQTVKGFVERKVVADGEVEIRIRSMFKLDEKSSIVQDLIAYSDTPRVDFQTKIQWNSKHKALKVGFDLDILCQTAKSEIQFGHIDRPTTENTLAETAKFEVCNHKWTDISESRFGVAILNDSKYGISVRESDVRLSLHLGGCRPDYTGDAGIHETTYSILPHGTFSADNVIKSAYELNYNTLNFCGKLKEQVSPPVEIDADNVICETVKPAEDNDGSYILRLYEAEKNKTIVNLTFPQKVKKAFITNMLEENLQELPIENGKATLTFKPFEIKTIKVY